jgi:small multidrug resistance pump
MNALLLLTLAILFEVAGTTLLKISEGFSKSLPSFFVFVFYGVSFTLLAYALKTIEVGIAYAIWSGLGTALIAGIGVIYFGESLTIIKVISLILIIAGVIGLNLTTNIHRY